MHPIHDVANPRANVPEPPQQRRDDADAARREPQTEDWPELPDPAEVGESG
jgi:hypothetical protein